MTLEQQKLNLILALKHNVINWYQYFELWRGLNESNPNTSA